MRISRRFAVTGLAAAVLAPVNAVAQDWKAKYPEIVFAIIPAENASGVTDRWAPFTAHLAKELGIKVTLRIAQDYAAVIEGQKAGQIHIGSYGPSAFARALMTGAKVEAFAMDVNLDGTKGYHSVFYVKKDSPFQKFEDLKGKNLGLVDPNSTSGYLVPSAMFMMEMGVDPKKFMDTLKSFGVQSKTRRAVQQTVAYKIDGTPAMAVAGRYTVSAQQGRTQQGILDAVDSLVAVVRKQPK